MAGGMVGEALSPVQKLMNRYVFNGAVFAGLAALIVGRFALVDLLSWMCTACRPLSLIVVAKFCTRPCSWPFLYELSRLQDTIHV
jgi:hypothetical protein